MHDSGEKSRVALGRTYTARLRCPACGEHAPQELLRAHQILPISVPGKAFHRAFGWTQGRPTVEDSPLYHGLCLCPECRYPGLEWDFQAGSELPPPNVRSLRRLFVDEGAGRSTELNHFLPRDPSTLPQPERTLRLLFASVRAEMLCYPELWRKEVLGHIFQRIAWIYFDLTHLDWSVGDLTGPPGYSEHGPGAKPLADTLQGLKPLQETWPEIPLEQTRAFSQTLYWFEQHYQTHAQEPGAEELAREELRLGRLYGILGKTETARELYDRARQTAFLGRDEANRMRDEIWRGKGEDVSEWRAQGIAARRLVLLLGEITEERVSIFGSIMDNPSSRRRRTRAA